MPKKFKYRYDGRVKPFSKPVSPFKKKRSK